MTSATSVPVPAAVRQDRSTLSAVEGRERLILGAIVVLALLLRVAAVFRLGTIDTEGAEYARIAENFSAGRGYTGIETSGAELIFPPLFPMLIAATSLVVGQAELAGRLVSLLLGTLLVLPVYFIARELHGRHVALVAGLLIALHPLLVGFAASVYCESTFMTLLMSGVFLSLRVFRAPTVRTLLLTGCVFGAAYLVRPEAALYAVLAAGIVAVLQVARGHSVRVAVQRGVVLFAGFAVLALPYVLWFHAQSGQWRLEGKSPLNYATELRIEQGREPYDASFGVGPDLSEHGVWMKPHAVALSQVKMPPGEIARYVIRRAKSVVPFLKNTLVDGGMLGSPLLFVLSAIGLFAKPWSRPVALANLFCFAILASAASALFFIFYLSPRFLITFVPFLSIWAASGVVALCTWLAATVQLLREKGASYWPSVAFGALLVLAVPLSTLQGVEGLYELRMFSAEHRPIKIAGEWLDHYAPGQKVVTDSLDVLPFHAHATFVPLPYAESSTALRYLRQRQVRFIVLHDADKTSTPYLDDWLKEGVPAPGAVLIYNEASPALGRILIYELKQSAMKG